MSRGGFMVYKCRRCGLEFADSHVPDVLVAAISIMTSGRTPSSWGITMGERDSHNCNDKQIGIADLVGFDKD